MLAELVLPVDLPVDRDEVEDRIVAALGDEVEITGAGVGLGGSNLDLELTGDADRHAQVIASLLRALGVAGATLRMEGQSP